MKTSKLPYSVSLQSLISNVKKQEEKEKHIEKTKSKSENEKNDLKK